MKTLVIGALLAVCSFSASASMRCDKGIASEGDRSSEERMKCGAPASQSVIGYTLNAQGEQEFKQEEWVYGPRNGMFYYLTFEAERLKSIASKRGQ